MRFLADGPSILDELLIARDEGRVVFFCGAGVSRARAGLSDFFGLAQRVIDTLGVITDSPARRIVEEVRGSESRMGVSGIISADRERASRHRMGLLCTDSTRSSKPPQPSFHGLKGPWVCKCSGVTSSSRTGGRLDTEGF